MWTRLIVCVNEPMGHYQSSGRRRLSPSPRAGAAGVPSQRRLHYTDLRARAANHAPAGGGRSHLSNRSQLTLVNHRTPPPPPDRHSLQRDRSPWRQTRHVTGKTGGTGAERWEPMGAPPPSGPSPRSPLTSGPPPCSREGGERLPSCLRR